MNPAEAEAPLRVDFRFGIVGARRRFVGNRRQPLARAIGMGNPLPTVVDATAGLARDAFLLACLGYHVLAIERSAVLSKLVNEALARAEAEPDDRLHAILRRLTFVEGDSRDILSTMHGELAADVVYLDPMYPPKSKSALPKKELRICRAIVGDDPDADELFAVARRVARKRVVVKRLRHAPPLSPNPTVRYVGTRVRYDAYVS